MRAPVCPDCIIISVQTPPEIIWQNMNRIESGKFYVESSHACLCVCMWKPAYVVGGLILLVGAEEHVLLLTWKTCWIEKKTKTNYIVTVCGRGAFWTCRSFSVFTLSATKSLSLFFASLWDCSVGEGLKVFFPSCLSFSRWYLTDSDRRDNDLLRSTPL